MMPVIHALEAKNIRVLPAFAGGLDGRPAINEYFMDETGAKIDALISLTGFSLVGGPAYNDNDAAVEVLRKLDIPYIAAHPLEFQTLGQWSDADQGLGPIETTMLIALPELDGATNPTVFGGRLGPEGCNGCQYSCPCKRRQQANGCPAWSGSIAWPKKPCVLRACGSVGMPRRRWRLSSLVSRLTQAPSAPPRI